MNKKFSIIRLVATVMIIASFTVMSVNAAAPTLKGKVVVNGSSALLPLTLQAAKEFKQANPGVMISASASSSIAGPQGVEKNAAQIGACDWDATKDVPGFKAFSGQVAHPVAVIPFATIVHKDVKVSNLTTKQLQGIFSGEITNWKEVGGDDADIIVVNRAFGSGTRVNYQLKALDSAEFMKSGKNYKEVKSSGDMYTAVKTTPNSIGYIDLVYVKDDVKAVKFNGIEATTENVVNGKYAIWAYGYYMTKPNPDAATKAFIEFIQSNKFQQGTLKKLKFIPVSSMKTQK